MSPAPKRDHLAELGNAVAAYLNTMTASADCVEQTYPDVGRIYGQRIRRLRSRVSFHATSESVAESAQTLEAELKDFANAANRTLTQRSVELTTGILALGDIIEDYHQHQEFFSRRLSRLAAEVESSSDSVHAAGLRGLIADMGDESASLASRMREQMIDLDRGLAGTASIDAATGLINRRELERQIEAHTLHGSVYTLLVFELSGPMSDQVLRMAGERLATKFRHPEWIARWSTCEFAVLFLGDPDVAQARADEASACIDGSYTLENGETVLMAARANVPQPELAAH